MGKGSLAFCMFTAFFFCCCFNACLQDKGSGGYDEEQCFFDVSGADERLCPIISQLKRKNDSTDFVTDFVGKYGYPLWWNAYGFPEQESLAFAVPVRGNALDAEIEAVWFFSVYSDYTEYRIYTREMANRLTAAVGGDGVEETWMFDYFTRAALHRKPKSNLMFIEDVATTTRSTIEIEHCVHAYAGYEGAEGDLGVHCWTTVYFVSDNIDMRECGGGGGGSSGSLDTGYGSGGGGGASASQPGTQTDPTSPCGKAQSLSRDYALKVKVCELFDGVQNYHVGDTENGWIKTAAGQYIAPTERKEKSMKYSASSLIGQKITEEYHCHPAGTCFPSFPDLRVLATRYQKGQIDVANFSYGVVSSMGCFTMVITSEEAFKVFAEKVLNDPGVKSVYNTMHAKVNTNGVNSAIAKFIDFLKKEVSGLDVLFSAASFDDSGGVTLSNWQAKDSNGNAGISNYNCN